MAVSSRVAYEGDSEVLCIRSGFDCPFSSMVPTILVELVTELMRTDVPRRTGITLTLDEENAVCHYYCLKGEMQAAGAMAHRTGDQFINKYVSAASGQFEKVTGKPLHFSMYGFSRMGGRTGLFKHG
jgi:hypothetical protein